MDDDAVARAVAVLDAKGIRVDPKVMREAVTAAETLPPPRITVSQRMIEAGRRVWERRSSDPVHILLPELYRTMYQAHIDERA